MATKLNLRILALITGIMIAAMCMAIVLEY